MIGLSKVFDEVPNLDDGEIPTLAVSTQPEQDSSVSLSDIIKFIGGATGVGVTVCDSNYKIIYTNGTTRELLDVPKDLLQVGRLGTDVIKYMHERKDFGEDFGPEDIGRHLSHVFKRLTNGSNSQETWTIVQNCGAIIGLTNLYSKDGYLVFLVKDRTLVTQRKKLLKIALKNGKAGYWSMNFKAKDFTFSDHLKSLFTEDEQKRCSDEGLWALLPPDEVERVKEIWSDGFRGKKTFGFTHKVLLEKTGISYFHTTARPDYSARGKPIGVTCFVTDVTEKHSMVAELTEAKEASDKALVDRNKYLARMSHEIRTPMNGILGMADALIHNEEFASAKKQLTVIKDSANNLLRVLDETLEHARFSAGKIKITPILNDPRDMLKTLHTLWREKAEENGTKLSLHIDPKIPQEIEFDRFRIEQCLNNFISNAVKFTQNGKVQIISTFKAVEGKKPTFVLAIKDTGIGMTPDQQTRVFTPFEQADESISLRFGGTGLGMPIAKNFIELMGGTVTVKSQIDVGSTFIMAIPTKTSETEKTKATTPSTQPEKNNRLNELQDTSKEPIASETSKPVIANLKPSTPLISSNPSGNSDVERFQHLRVLVAEDNATNQVVIKALLSPLVGEIFFASNGAEAISTLSSNVIDLVLMDIHMPVMDGIEATISIRSSDKAWGKVGIIALTADPEYQQKRICRNIGMNSAISKPVSRRDLIDAFDEVLLELGQAGLRRAKL